MKGGQRRYSFQTQAWYRKHISKTHQINRISNWVANKQLDNKKKGGILDASIKLQRFQMMELLKEISKVVKNERPGIDRKLIKFLITNLKFNFDNLQFIQLISKFLEYRYIQKDTYISRQDEPYSCLYLLLEGKCDIISIDTLRTVTGEAVFGERQLFEGITSKHSIKCKSGCQFLVIKSSDFKNQKKKVQLSSSKNILGVLKKIPIFRCFTESQLMEMSRNAQIVNFQQKGNIIHQNQKHGYFYIIFEGEFCATENVSFKEVTLSKLDSIFNKLPILNIKNTSEHNELYKFSIIQLSNVFKNPPKMFRQMITTKIQSYKKLSYNRHRASPERQKKSKEVAKSYSNIGPFISELSEDFQQVFDLDPSWKQSYTEQLRSKINLFTKAKKLSRSSDNRSGSIRSKTSKLVELSNLHQNIQIDQSRSNSFLLHAYKQKIQNSTNIQLDVQNRLYRNPTHFFKKYHLQEDLSRTMKMDKTITSFKLSHKYNKSQVLTRKSNTADQGRRRDTQILLRRVQMSSCRKRRNRVKVMFDPKEILNFNQTQESRAIIKLIEDDQRSQVI